MFENDGVIVNLYVYRNSHTLYITALKLEAAYTFEPAVKVPTSIECNQSRTLLISAVNQHQNVK
jgi:hypothetical protein